MSTDLVLARFKENIDWIAQVDPSIRIIVYNKFYQESGTLEVNGRKYEAVILPNVGKEGHTYLHHIMKSWGRLADQTIFCQADPWPHLLRKDSFISELVDNNITRFTQQHTHKGSDKSLCHTPPGFIDTNLQETWQKWFGKPLGVTFTFHAKGAFKATKEQLYRSPYHFYKGILKELEYAVAPTERYVLERAWETILSQGHKVFATFSSKPTETLSHIPTGPTDALRNVDLICIDTRADVSGSIKAIEICKKHVQFKTIKLITNRDIGYEHQVIIPDINISSRRSYSRFCVEELWKYITGTHCLIVQADGYILNPAAWTDDWLKYDIMGASLMGACNGGFSLRSKAFCKRVAEFHLVNPGLRRHPEDIAYTRWHRETFIKEGFKIAPIPVLDLFSKEFGPWTGQFGFHSFRTVVPKDILNGIINIAVPVTEEVTSKLLCDMVDLICIDTRADVSGSIKAIEISKKHIKFKNIKFITNRDIGYEHQVLIPDGQINNIKSYSKFCVEELWKYITGTHCLIVQHDGYIMNPAAWTDDWLKCDYIGAENGCGGNGGFSLRSKAFCKFVSEFYTANPKLRYDPEDRAYAQWNASHFKANGFNLADTDMRNRFATGYGAWSVAFGFHGSHIVTPNDLTTDRITNVDTSRKYQFGTITLDLQLQPVCEFSFLADGGIAGNCHRNESFYKFDGTHLSIFDVNMNITTTFYKSVLIEGTTVFIGKYQTKLIRRNRNQIYLKAL